jgi:beta-glucosidase/6-phospho-beta-glucosidase/beta-galactosidase
MAWPFAPGDGQHVGAFSEVLSQDANLQSWTQLRQTGARWLRINVSRSDTETNQGMYDWTTYDQAVDTIVGLGLEPILTLMSTPNWASLNSGTSCAAKSEPRNASQGFPDFGTFCTQIGTRYCGKVRYYQIWNEPNGAGNFIVTSGCEGPDDPAKAVRDYCQLLKTGADALRTVDSNIKVLMGGMGSMMLDSWAMGPRWTAACRPRRWG